MFDFSFGELMVVALVALVVLFLNPQLIGLGTSTSGQPSVTPSGEPSESETPSAPPSSRPPSSRPPTTPAMPPIQAKDPLLVDRVNHAMTIDGPEIINNKPKIAIGICHQISPKKPDIIAANAVPKAPTAKPIAAKIPANLATSKAAGTAA